MSIEDKQLKRNHYQTTFSSTVVRDTGSEGEKRHLIKKTQIDCEKKRERFIVYTTHSIIMFLKVDTTRTTYDDVHPATLNRDRPRSGRGRDGLPRRVRPLLAASRLLFLLLLLLLSFKATATKTRVPYITETEHRFFGYNVRVVHGVHT